MSELKSYKMVDEKYCTDCVCVVPSEVYLKSEADKVIEDIVKGASSMFREFSMCRGLDTKSPLGRIADVAFKHWNRVEYIKSINRQLKLDVANLLYSNENLHRQLKDEMTGRLTDKIEYDLDIRHHKYQRCLAMARWCEMSRRELYTRACLPTTQNWNRHEEWLYFVNYWGRYESKFKALAEKFKEAK